LARFLLPAETRQGVAHIQLIHTVELRLKHRYRMGYDHCLSEEGRVQFSLPAGIFKVRNGDLQSHFCCISPENGQNDSVKQT
jgi:hypothetical protein